jgi:DNA-binding transcriptional MerR regulator
MQNQNSYKKEIPDKLYFKIGEVSEIAELPSHVLRFWETEFAKINPRRTPSGQRLYRPRDVERILEIKYLLYEKKYTIAGARKQLNARTAKKDKDFEHFLDELRSELQAIRKLLD